LGGGGGGFGGDIFVAIPVTFPFRPVLLVTAARRDHPAERIDRDVLGVVRAKHLKMICGGCKADCCCTVLYGGLLLHEKRGNDNNGVLQVKKCWSNGFEDPGHTKAYQSRALASNRPATLSSFSRLPGLSTFHSPQSSPCTLSY
jgi:hypothetical protein